ncbi:hypothetical protein DOTSEDRAFT_21025 [Dothistroma septosporum NZE10]|uniref:Uncharacterized protein n=1 Tax=Dothistroma septosporum (strain NZE10 / CBS 128990) TaxID=675120 RepID=N1PV31_DOTSN|nr:hypothetical protein DOTSEDRAFT_21025 [Dothistroma septosporum NZE10]
MARSRQPIAHPPHPDHQPSMEASSIFTPALFSLSAITPDSDPSVDDWHAFAGNPSHYSDFYDRSSAFLYGIAATFVSRAKRAYAAGKGWEEFEKDERREDSMTMAKAKVDPVRKKIMMQEDLDNGVRLAVFQELKSRLREEIWGERGTESEEEGGDKVNSRIHSPVAKSGGMDEDSTVERFALGPGQRLLVEWREEKE